MVWLKWGGGVYYYCETVACLVAVFVQESLNPLELLSLVLDVLCLSLTPTAASWTRWMEHFQTLFTGFILLHNLADNHFRVFTWVHAGPLKVIHRFVSKSPLLVNQWLI